MKPARSPRSDSLLLQHRSEQRSLLCWTNLSFSAFGTSSWLNRRAITHHIPLGLPFPLSLFRGVYLYFYFVDALLAPAVSFQLSILLLIPAATAAATAALAAASATAAATLPLAVAASTLPAAAASPFLLVWAVLPSPLLLA